jgi:hypothetical protein
MNPRRRGVLAALLSSPAFLRAERIEQTTTVELPKEFTLKVTCHDKTITLTADEIMTALEDRTTEVPPGAYLFPHH